MTTSTTDNQTELGLDMDILESTFVERSFYVEPPQKNASVEEWKAWDEKDTQARTQAKAKHTRIQNILAEANGEQIDVAVPELCVRKINGCYRQVSPVALTGDFEQGTGSLEPACEEQQTKAMILARQQAENAKRGSSTSNSRSSRRRAAKRLDRQSR